MTTAAHTAAPLAAITTTLDQALSGRSWATIRGAFRTFAQFADAAAANLPADATKDDAVQLCAILTAARDSHGTLALRLSYAAHLARHGADNPLER